MLGGLIDVVDTSKYTVCVCCAQNALKCMIMLTQTLTSIILKHQPANHYILLISNTNYTFYISLCSSFSALLNKPEIFLLGGAIHICSYVY